MTQNDNGADRSNIALANGRPVPADNSHAELKPNGQQAGYVTLTEQERAKGFVRPVRDTYRHVGTRPTFPTRELTADEKAAHADRGYVLYEQYPESEAPVRGRFWTQAQLDSGCGHSTTMSRAIAETYARDPGFYGATFCSHCREHFPVSQFSWAGTDERVGS